MARRKTGKKVGWKKGNGKFYTRYTIPRNPRSPVQQVTRIRKGGGDFRLKKGGTFADIEQSYHDHYGNDRGIPKSKQKKIVLRLKK